MRGVGETETNLGDSLVEVALPTDELPDRRPVRETTISRNIFLCLGRKVWRNLSSAGFSAIINQEHRAIFARHTVSSYHTFGHIKFVVTRNKLTYLCGSGYIWYNLSIKKQVPVYKSENLIF